MEISFDPSSGEIFKNALSGNGLLDVNVSTPPIAVSYTHLTLPTKA